MYNRRVGAAILVTALAISAMAGCGSQEEESSEKVTEIGTQVQPATQAAEVNGTEAAATEIQEPQYPEIVSDKKIKEYDTVVVVGDCAYELYTYLDEVADNYAKSVNAIAEDLEGKADVYNMVIPLSSGITFPDNLQDQIKSSDQREAMQKDSVKSLMNNVHVVDIYDSLMQQSGMNISIFRTGSPLDRRLVRIMHIGFLRGKGD